MGLRDDCEASEKIGGVWGPPKPAPFVTVDTSIWSELCDGQIRQANRIGRARCAVEMALIAVRDNGSKTFVLRQLQDAMEALQ